jgi:hypothetical protein
MVGGELQLIRAEPRGEVAPLVRPDTNRDTGDRGTAGAVEATR